MAAPSTSTLPDAAGDDKIIDMETFNQLLEIDDDDSREFSKDLARQYVNQAATTFVDMDAALANKDLDGLSKLGHFIKGSSASIGLISVSKSCASMQNLGSLKDEDGNSDIDADTALKQITELLKTLKVEQEKAKQWLMNFYGEKW